MIVDKLSNLSKYEQVNKNLKAVIEFIKKTNLLGLPLGKHEIDGENAFVVRDRYYAKPIEECFFEGHRNYADIQVVLKGHEYIGYRNIHEKDVKVTMPYDSAIDLGKFEVSEFTSVILSDNIFALVFPDDLHMPKLKSKDHVEVEKLIFKIKI